MSDFLSNIMENLLVVFKIAWAAGVVVLVMAGVIVMLSDGYSTVTRPLRRAEEAGIFLDLVAATLKQGRPLEETMISAAKSRDESMGLKFHLLAARLELGLSLNEALAQVPDFLPPQVNAMLRAGGQIGDLAKVLPAARHLLKDANSQMHGVLNCVVPMTLITMPVGCGMLAIFGIFIMPKFLYVFAEMGGTTGTGLMLFLTVHLPALIGAQVAILLLFWLTASIYIGGPRAIAKFPIWERLHYWMPWRRKRMQRDFSAMLAILLDAGVPEAAALTLAADCSANTAFRRRAARAVEALRQGQKLPEAVQQLDDSGEFRWRLRNAVAGPGGFLRALAGWHESLDARAFQQEQAAAQVVTTSLVLWSGLFVGLILVGFFTVLTSLINVATLW